MLPVLLIIFLDLDHSPSVFGVPQYIRPAHSIIFILVASVLIWYLCGRKLVLPAVTIASFAAHLGLDRPMFPLFAPISYDLYIWPERVSYVLLVLSIIVILIVSRKANSLKNG